jgi:hypothetical protein
MARRPKWYALIDKDGNDVNGMIRRQFAASSRIQNCFA